MTEHKSLPVWGWHLIINAGRCRKDLIADQDYLRGWTKSLVDEINMVAYGEPQVVHFGDGEPHLAGNTVIQLIETSNIMSHFCDQDGDTYLDVFSCKEFDPIIALKHFVNHFHPEDGIDYMFIVRKAPRKYVRDVDHIDAVHYYRRFEKPETGTTWYRI